MSINRYTRSAIIVSCGNTDVERMRRCRLRCIQIKRYCGWRILTTELDCRESIGRATGGIGDRSPAWVATIGRVTDRNRLSIQEAPVVYHPNYRFARC